VVLGAMLSWAVGRELRPDNPAKGVKLNKPGKRERFLSTVELAHLGEAFATAERTGVNRLSLAALRLLLLSGCRKNEILSLKWAYVDFEHAALRLPDSKTGAKVVPLGALPWRCLPISRTCPTRRSCSPPLREWVITSGCH